MRNFEPPAVSMQAIARSFQCVPDVRPDGRGPLPRAARASACRGWRRSLSRTGAGYGTILKTQQPVVAYYNEMLPVDHPKAVQEIIPRLGDHYGVRSSWQADAIRNALDAQQNGPLYPSPSGWTPRREFAAAQAAAEPRTAAFRPRGRQRSPGVEGLAGGPSRAGSGERFARLRAAVSSGGGRAPGGEVDGCHRSGSAGARRPARGETAAIHASVWGAWVYAFPDIDLYNLPKPARPKEKP